MSAFIQGNILNVFSTFLILLCITEVIAIIVMTWNNRFRP